MSKKYQYFAKKRHSERYLDTVYVCKRGVSCGYVTCKVCIKRVGCTRAIQKAKSNEKK